MEPDGQPPAPIINITGEKVVLGPLRRDLMPSARLQPQPARSAPTRRPASASSGAGARRIARVARSATTFTWTAWRRSSRARCCAGCWSHRETAHSAVPSAGLILPSPDPDRSAAILRERTAGLGWLQQIRERHGFDVNDHFLRHPSNYDLAKLIVYTEGKAPEETRDEILERVKL